MAVIFDLPSFMKVRSGSWRQSSGIIINRAIFTGETKALRLGPAARWTCELEFAATRSQTDLRQVRWFQAFMGLPGYAFRLPAVQTPQAASPVPATCLVNGGGQLGFTLACDGLPASTPILFSGHMISVALGPDDEQLITISQNYTSNAAGQVTFNLFTPLRSSPPDNAVVRLHVPTALMRIRDPAGWDAMPGRTYQFPALTAEEYF